MTYVPEPLSSFYPKHLLIETTTRCNLRCKQCARLEDKYSLADMQMETFYRLAPLFPHLREAALYGHGETFLHKQFFTMLEALKKHDVFVYVTSNGMLLNETVVSRLVELRLDRLSLSLDAVTPALFNEIRLGADFDTILENIRRINRRKRRLHRDDSPVLSIMFCAMKSNIQELPKLVRLADRLNMTHGVAVINITEYEAVEGECLDRYPDLATRYLSEAKSLAESLAVPLEIPGPLAKYIQPGKGPGLSARLFRNYREFQRSFDRKALLKIKYSRVLERLREVVSGGTSNEALPIPSDPHARGTQTMRVRNCRDPWDFLFVNVHGDVRICCVSHRIMGNVLEDDVDTIWNNEAYQEFRRKILSPDPPEECQHCPMRGWHDIPLSQASHTP